MTIDWLEVSISSTQQKWHLDTDKTIEGCRQPNDKQTSHGSRYQAIGLHGCESFDLRSLLRGGCVKCKQETQDTHTHTKMFETNHTLLPPGCVGSKCKQNCEHGETGNPEKAIGMIVRIVASGWCQWLVKTVNQLSIHNPSKSPQSVAYFHCWTQGGGCTVNDFGLTINLTSSEKHTGILSEVPRKKRNAEYKLQFQGHVSFQINHLWCLMIVTIDRVKHANLNFLCTTNDLFPKKRFYSKKSLGESLYSLSSSSSGSSWLIWKYRSSNASLVVATTRIQSRRLFFFKYFLVKYFRYLSEQRNYYFGRTEVALLTVWKMGWWRWSESSTCFVPQWQRCPDSGSYHSPWSVPSRRIPFGKERLPNGNLLIANSAKRVRKTQSIVHRLHVNWVNRK